MTAVPVFALPQITEATHSIMAVGGSNDDDHDELKSGELFKFQVLKPLI